MAARKKRGRPPKYEDKKQDVLDRISGGEDIVSIERDKDMPGGDVIRRWRREDDQFAKEYARARREQATSHVERAGEELEDILDLSGTDPRLAGPQVQAAKAFADFQQWRAARADPDTFGKKAEIGIVNKDDNSWADLAQRARDKKD